MALSDSGRNSAANGLATSCAYVSLHSADPGTTGASEIAGGSPAYGRRAATWAAAVTGTRSLSTGVVFDVPAGVTVSHFGLWTASTGGTFQGGDALRDVSNNPATETFGGQGTYTLTSASLTVNNS